MRQACSRGRKERCLRESRGATLSVLRGGTPPSRTEGSDKEKTPDNRAAVRTRGNRERDCSTYIMRENEISRGYTGTLKRKGGFGTMDDAKFRGEKNQGKKDQGV